MRERNGERERTGGGRDGRDGTRITRGDSERERGVYNTRIAVLCGIIVSYSDYKLIVQRGTVRIVGL